MKSELKLAMPGDKYPCLQMCVLGADKGVVVLFDNPRIGMVVHKGPSGSHLGFFSDSWDMSKFESFRGTVTLEA